MVINDKLLSNLAFTVTHLQRKSMWQDIMIGLKAKNETHIVVKTSDHTKTCLLTLLVESTMFSIGV